MEVLPKRFAKYKLQLHPTKTKIVNLDDDGGDDTNTFDFLGFTHYLGSSRKGNMILKRKTSSFKLQLALEKTGKWLRRASP